MTSAKSQDTEVHVVYKIYPTQELWTLEPLTDEEYLEIAKSHTDALKESMRMIYDQLTKS